MVKQFSQLFQLKVLEELYIMLGSHGHCIFVVLFRGTNKDSEICMMWFKSVFFKYLCLQIDAGVIFKLEFFFLTNPARKDLSINQDKNTTVT